LNGEDDKSPPGRRGRLLGRWLLASTAVLSLALVLGPGWIRSGNRPGKPDAPPPGMRKPAASSASTAPAGWEMPGAETYAALPPGPAAVEPFQDSFDDTLDGLDAQKALGNATLSSSFECIIEPYELVELGSPVRGLIEKLPVERSEFVEAGEVVIELDSGVERASVELAAARAKTDGVLKAREANLHLGTRRKNRAVKLYASKALSEDLLDQADTEAAVARLELEQARESRLLASLELEQAREVLERRMIRSPISGVIVDRMMSEGETVDEEKILKIAQLDPLRVEVILPSTMFGAIESGMRASITPELAADRVHVAEVEIVDRVIDPASGTFGVRLVLPNPDHAIPSGLHCQVRFLSE
jgi:RND family efflux transporter MFP subunit